MSRVAVVTDSAADLPAQIAAARVELVTAVTRAYLEALRQREAVVLAEAQLERSRFNLRLASGRQEVGAATPLDARQAEVQVGRSEVALLQARARLEAARIRLLQQIGLPPEEPLELTTAFELTEPRWSRDEILARAMEANPLLRARRAREDAASTRVRSARSAYLPSLAMSAGIGGFTRQASSTAGQLSQARAQVAQQVEQCAATNELFRRLAEPLPPQDCSRFAFTDAMRRSILESNDQFPLSFINQPPQASLTISVPIFQGLSRQRDVEAAEASRDDARQDVRAQELAVAADVAVAFSDLSAAYQSAVLEARNRELAEEQLRLARERYQLGGITFVDLVEAETVLAEADQAYVNAVYAYHDAVTTVEAVVGQTMREP
ncbi:MAG: TolC family protein [Gemmatimonadetes bacterium]|nr:TolC family protein [Gemmatimonadota bacterium]